MSTTVMSEIEAVLSRHGFALLSCRSDEALYVRGNEMLCVRTNEHWTYDQDTTALTWSLAVGRGAAELDLLLRPPPYRTGGDARRQKDGPRVEADPAGSERMPSIP